MYVSFNIVAFHSEIIWKITQQRRAIQMYILPMNVPKVMFFILRTILIHNIHTKHNDHKPSSDIINDFAIYVYDYISVFITYKYGKWNTISSTTVHKCAYIQNEILPHFHVQYNCTTRRRVCALCCTHACKTKTILTECGGIHLATMFFCNVILML